MPSNQYNKIAKDFTTDISFGKKYVAIPMILEMATGLRGNVLDAGCGRGEITREIAKSNSVSIVGVDISKEMIKIAKEVEKNNPVGIEYHCEDILKFETAEKFDNVISVFLLNYAETEIELKKMFEKFYNFLSDGGQCLMITINPNLKPSKKPIGGRLHINLLGKENFENGDKIKTVIDKDGKEVSFEHYYYSKEVYESVAKDAGFRTVKWIKPFFSEEGLEKFGKEFCEEYLKSSSTIGLFCSR